MLGRIGKEGPRRLNAVFFNMKGKSIESKRMKEEGTIACKAEEGHFTLKFTAY